MDWLIDYPIQNCHTSSGVRKRETPFGHKTVGSRTQSQQTRAITPEDEGRQIGLEKGDWIWRHGLHLFGPASHEVCWVLYETSELILVLWMRPWPGIGVYLNLITCTLWHEHVYRGFVVHIILTCVAVLSIMTYTWSSRRSSPDMNLAKFLMIFQEKELEPAYHLFVQYCKERPERSQDLQFLYEQVSNWAAQSNAVRPVLNHTSVMVLTEIFTIAFGFRKVTQMLWLNFTWWRESSRMISTAAFLNSDRLPKSSSYKMSLTQGDFYTIACGAFVK